MAGLVVTGCARTPQDQLASGQALYETHCVRCHEVDGGIGPELTPAVLRTYRTARQVFAYVRLAMPYDAPGSLRPDEYWDAVAYLLLKTGVRDAARLLTLESAEEALVASP